MEKAHRRLFAQHTQIADTFTSTVLHHLLKSIVFSSHLTPSQCQIVLYMRIVYKIRHNNNNNKNKNSSSSSSSRERGDLLVFSEFQLLTITGLIVFIITHRTTIRSTVTGGVRHGLGVEPSKNVA